MRFNNNAAMSMSLLNLLELVRTRWRYKKNQKFKHDTKYEAIKKTKKKEEEVKA